MSDREHKERARALLAGFDEPVRHLDFDAEMVPFVDGTLGPAEQEIVESHLEDCLACREEVDDLRRLAVRRGPRRAAILAIAAAVTVAISVAVVVSRPRRQPSLPVMVQSQPRLPDEWRRLVEETLSTGRLPISPALPQLKSGDTELRGGATPRMRVEPDGVVVETAQPRFTWPAAPHASYRVFVFANEREVAGSGPLERAQWVPSRPLARGRAYQWQVETTRGGSRSIAPAPQPARFFVVSERDHEELVAARANGDPLLLAVLYARAGLTEPSVGELKKLAGSRDERVQRLLRSYEASPNSTKPAQ